MDSGNSGSLQSSSGGDDEYDSRAAEYTFTTIPHAPPPQFIDPLSAYLQLHQNPSSLLLNSPNPIRSDPNPSHVAEFPAPAPLSSNAHHQQQAPAARNPKKRSRASRRAPTTVLTTDTANFRAMVQEFTGIPAPPFSSSSSFPRSRIDLFAPRSAASVDSPPPPPYLRRHLPNLFNIPNQNQNQNQNQNILTSLLQSNAKFPFPAASKPQNDFRFGFGHRNQVSETLPNLIPSDHNHHNDFDFGGKISNGGKSPVRGGEGMVESWICSSE
ncbi:autism susceptibility gene 2 protein homolog [Salvia hispanica]|uniref:autism susceptibility gene 2 protein homolog n=1 Tax=Salvia hispanica TaxID=49212 RepID=UPI0020096F1D|nr:autism susceptibility gene 2 protein homolog [Salvia hispanica]